jgi:uncharacterized cupredoxin-like copper-binding protein
MLRRTRFTLPMILVLACVLIAAAPEPNRVNVRLVEFKIEMPSSLPGGPTLFEVTNAGRMVHNIKITGEGIDKVFPSVLQPGESQTMQVDLKPGRYKVVCPVDSHELLGMSLDLMVTQPKQSTAAADTTTTPTKAKMQK